MIPIFTGIPIPMNPHFCQNGDSDEKFLKLSNISFNDIPVIVFVNFIAPHLRMSECGSLAMQNRFLRDVFMSNDIWEIIYLNYTHRLKWKPLSVWQAPYARNESLKKIYYIIIGKWRKLNSLIDDCDKKIEFFERKITRLMYERIEEIDYCDYHEVDDRWYITKIEEEIKKFEKEIENLKKKRAKLLKNKEYHNRDVVATKVYNALKWNRR